MTLKKLGKSAGLLERTKYVLCRQFVIYLRMEKVTERRLAKKLGTTEARVRQIVQYDLDKVTVDRLVGYLAIIRPKATLKWEFQKARKGR